MIGHCVKLHKECSNLTGNNYHRYFHEMDTKDNLSAGS